MRHPLLQGVNHPPLQGVQTKQQRARSRKVFLQPYPTDHPIIQFLLRTYQSPSSLKDFFFLSLSLFFFLFTWLFLLDPFYLALVIWLLLSGSCYLALFTRLFKTTLILPLSCPHLTLSRFQTLTRFFQPTTLLFSRSPIAHSFTIHNSPPPDQSPPSSITHHPSPTKKKDTAPTEPHPDITSHFLHIYRSYGANQRTRIMHILVNFKLTAISIDLGDFYVKRSQRDSPIQIKR